MQALDRTSVQIYVPELALVALLIATAARLVGVALAKTALIIWISDPFGLAGARA